MASVKKLIKLLFGSQIAIWRAVIRALIKFIKLYSRAILNDIRNTISHIKYKSGLQKKIKAVIDLDVNNKTEFSWNDITSEFLATEFDEANVKISFCAAARHQNNPNCQLFGFLQSIIDNCDDLNCVEVLLAIDPDDDMYYFVDLKRKFSKQLRFLIYVVKERLGYENLHLYDTLLFQNLAKNTRMICDYSDDCIITLQHFDKKLLEIDSLYSDNVYFIHTRDTERHKYLGDVSKNIQLLYWVMQAKEPASYFPIFSKKVLDIATSYAKDHDKNNSWSPIANTWICDCYVDILSCYIQRLGANRIHYLDVIEMNKTVLASYQHADPITGLTPNNRAFIKMLNDETLQYLDGLSKAVMNELSLEMCDLR